MSSTAFLHAARALGVIPECLAGPNPDTRHLDYAMLNEGLMLAALGDIENWRPTGYITMAERAKAAEMTITSADPMWW